MTDPAGPFQDGNSYYSNLPKQTQVKSKPRQRKKLKENGLKCYGFLLDNGQFDHEKYASGDFVFILRSTITDPKKRSFINAKLEADWLSIATFKESKKGRVEGNISHISCNYLDLDGHHEIVVSEDCVIQRCNLLGLPRPLIIETSPGRFHVKFYYKRPLKIDGKAELSYWHSVQKGLYEAFKDLGPDSKAQDAVRFLRNQHQKDAINTKYPFRPKIFVREIGKKCALADLYRALKAHGFIEGSRQDRIPLEVSRTKLIRFLKYNGYQKLTYEELSGLLGIPLRTLKLLCSHLKSKGWLKTQICGKGRDRKTEFISLIIKVHKEDLNAFGGDSLSILDKFLSDGADVGFRNLTTFAGCLVLKRLKHGVLSESDAIRELERGFLLCARGKHRFEKAEFLKCIRSALKEKYRFLYSRRKLLELGLVGDG